MKSTTRKHRKEGGEIEHGERDWEEDEETKPEDRTNAKKIDEEAEEKKRGGRAKRKFGGHVHHEKMEEMKHAKHVGPVKGEAAVHHAGRKPRKSGGRTGSDTNPLSSAAKGKEPRGHSEEIIS